MVEDFTLITDVEPFGAGYKQPAPFEDIVGKEVEIIGPRGSKLIGKQGRIIRRVWRADYDDVVFLVEFGVPLHPRGPTQIWHLRDQMKVL